MKNPAEEALPRLGIAFVAGNVDAAVVSEHNSDENSEGIGIALHAFYAQNFRPPNGQSVDFEADFAVKQTSVVHALHVAVLHVRGFIKLLAQKSRCRYQNTARRTAATGLDTLPKRELTTAYGVHFFPPSGVVVREVPAFHRSSIAHREQAKLH